MHTPRTSDLHCTLKDVSGELFRLSNAIEHLSNQHYDQLAAVATVDLPSLLGCDAADLQSRARKAKSPKNSKSSNRMRCAEVENVDTDLPFLGKHAKPVPPLIVHAVDDIDNTMASHQLPKRDVDADKGAVEMGTKIMPLVGEVSSKSLSQVSLRGGVPAEEVGLVVSAISKRPPNVSKSSSQVSFHEVLADDTIPVSAVSNSSQIRSESRDFNHMASCGSLPSIQEEIFNSEGEFQYSLWPTWTKAVEEFGNEEIRHSHRMSTVMLGTIGIRSAGFLHRTTTRKRGSPILEISGWIINPASRRCFFWQVLGGLLIVFDVIIVPMQVFDLPSFWFFWCMNIAIICYWMIDCGLQFITGYEIRGSTVEMRPYFIARNYLRTWFVPDVAVIIADITCLILGIGKQASHSWHISKSRRALRIVRVFRLVRILKMFFLTKRILSFIQSEHLLLLIRIGYALGMVLLTCHYAGCYWFAVGDLDSAQRRYGDTWIDASHLRHAGIADRYIASLHWALAQSGLASIAIVPTNAIEHFYASCFTAVWLCQLSVVISIFVGGLIRIRDANINQVTQEAAMRKYLYLNNVSIELTERTLRFFRLNYQACLRRVHESDLEFFKELPLMLQVALHREVYQPILRTHPLFARLGKLQSYICHLAMREQHFNAQERIFQVNDFLYRMLCMVDGRFDYYVKEFAQRPTGSSIDAGEWMGEPCFWFQGWRCRGRLQSACSTEVIELNCDKFREILETASDSEVRGIIDPMLKYAQGLLDIASHGEVVTDRILEGQSRRLVYHAFQCRTGTPPVGFQKSSGLSWLYKNLSRANLSMGPRMT